MNTEPLDDDTDVDGRIRGQLRFAQTFATTYSNKFRHAHGIGWHRYDGTRWATCEDGAETRAVVALVKDHYNQLSTLEDDARKQLLRDIEKVESANGVKGALALAGDMRPIALAATALDADPELLNTANGTLNLHTGQLAAPTPADNLSKVTRAKFTASTSSTHFQGFLRRVQPEAEMRDYLARSLGSALLGRVIEQRLQIWNGQGANGKGTLRDAVRHALGDYAIEVPPEIMLMSKYGQQGMAPERMRLKGARVAFCSEIPHGAKLDEATMKRLTGGDPVNAKLLYRNPIEFDPSHTFFMLTNHLPQVRGDDPATWRRLIAVPFNTVVPEKERDGNLPERLKREADAVLAWLWGGWQDYLRNGLNPPKQVVDATRQYQLDSDIVARFLADENAVSVGVACSERSSTLYEGFKKWCRAQGEDADLTQKSFTEAMEKHGYEKRRTGSGVVWRGVMVAASDEQAA